MATLTQPRAALVRRALPLRDYDLPQSTPTTLAPTSFRYMLSRVGPFLFEVKKDGDGDPTVYRVCTQPGRTFCDCPARKTLCKHVALALAVAATLAKNPDWQLENARFFERGCHPACGHAKYWQCGFWRPLPRCSGAGTPSMTVLYFCLVHGVQGNP